MLLKYFIFSLQINQKSAPPAVPVLNLRPKNNGLLTTIEQAAMSDEEPGSPTLGDSNLGPPFHQGSSRIPTPKLSTGSTNNQPNYENVAGGRLTESPLGSMIPIAKKTSLPIDRVSTANFVATNQASGPRKHSADLVSRTLATPSPRPMPMSKIPVPGSHQK